jgi:hypothetical protein
VGWVFVTNRASEANYNLKYEDMKKPPVRQFPKPRAVAQSDDRSWHNGGDIEIGSYARSLHKAARTLIGNLDLQPNTKSAWDACPLILLYRQAIELHLKALVGEGSIFLKERTDPLSLAKTHSLRWLAQIVGQIIKAVRWENEFKCEGVATLADFSDVVNRLELMDPVSCVVQPKSRKPDGSVPDQLRPPTVVQFARTLDSLLDLLDSTADALAATKPLMEHNRIIPGIKPTIH